MTSRQLFDAGKLQAAIEALGSELRDNPSDSQRRVFLFELLCFAGNFDRAEKQLDILSSGGPEAGMGALLYRSALHAERLRAEMFRSRTFPLEAAPAVEISGTLNGKPFHSIEDGDPRIGARLEVFAAGQYLWLPWAHVASLKIEPPKRLRDLLWTPALLTTSEDFRGQELGEILLPSLAPLSFESDDDEIRLGRATDWVDLPDGDFAPVGQKMLAIDGEQVPLLSIRELRISRAGTAAS
ncbi:MAG TPA: type VI secretion system accessory protein TagJ [Bryobacteraceae bacterium]|jgi:type VI secretion system protein ImpE|nr:type VI secretion system accessory protein TagJ [Bryobacteraceae bacterium]